MLAVDWWHPAHAKLHQSMPSLLWRKRCTQRLHLWNRPFLFLETAYPFLEHCSKNGNVSINGSEIPQCARLIVYKSKWTVQACSTADFSVQRWNYEAKCGLLIGGLCLMRKSMVCCGNYRTGLCAPCVSENRNGAFPLLEQLVFSVSIFGTFFQK